MWDLALYGITGIGAFLAFAGLRIVRPTTRGLIERMGKYQRLKGQGITWIIPLIERIYRVNITEQLADIAKQEIITADNLNAMVDLQIYYKVNPSEDTVKASQYNVYNFQEQIVALARTTMRNVIGTKRFVEVNSMRNVLNVELKDTMQDQVKAWGVEIVRVELKEINPPKDVQDTMNSVIKAENTKKAAIDFATAKETEADGFRRAAIKQADGEMQAKILRATGDARSIQLVNEAAEKYFVGNAQTLKKMEVTQASLQANSKIVLTEKGIQPILVLGNETVIPIKEK